MVDMPPVTRETADVTIPRLLANARGVDLAAEVGITQATASRWITGQSIPKDEHAAAIARFVGRPVEVVSNAIIRDRLQRAGEKSAAASVSPPPPTDHQRLMALEATVSRLEAWARGEDVPEFVPLRDVDAARRAAGELAAQRRREGA